MLVKAKATLVFSFALLFFAVAPVQAALEGFERSYGNSPKEDAEDKVGDQLRAFIDQSGPDLKFADVEEEARKLGMFPFRTNRIYEGVRHYHLLKKRPLKPLDIVLAETSVVVEVRGLSRDKRTVAVEAFRDPMLASSLYNYSHASLSKTVPSYDGFKATDRIIKPVSFRGNFPGTIVNVFENGYAEVSFDGYRANHVSAISDLKHE